MSRLGMNSAQTRSRKTVVVVGNKHRVKSVGVPPACSLYPVADSPLHEKYNVSFVVASLFLGKGGRQALHQGFVLGVVRDAGVRCDGLPSDAPGRRGAPSPPLRQGHQPRVGRTPAQALGERPEVDGAVLHRRNRQRQHGRRHGGTSRIHAESLSQSWAQLWGSQTLWDVTSQDVSVWFRKFQLTSNVHFPSVFLTVF